MHTFLAADGTAFHYNSDFSAAVIVCLADGTEVRIKGDALLEFVAKAYCLPAKIALHETLGTDSDQRRSALESAEPAELLLGTV